MYIYTYIYIYIYVYIYIYIHIYIHIETSTTANHVTHTSAKTGSHHYLPIFQLVKSASGHVVFTLREAFVKAAHLKVAWLWTLGPLAQMGNGDGF